MVPWPGMRLRVEDGAHRIARGHTAHEWWSHYSNLNLSDSTAMLLMTILGTTVLNNKSMKEEWKVHSLFKCLLSTSMLEVRLCGPTQLWTGWIGDGGSDSAFALDSSSSCITWCLMSLLALMLCVSTIQHLGRYSWLRVVLPTGVPGKITWISIWLSYWLLREQMRGCRTRDCLFSFHIIWLSKSIWF